MKTYSIAALFFLAISVHAYDENRTLTLDGKSVQSISIKAGSGTLEVRQGDDEIKVEAVIEVDGGWDGDEEAFVRENVELTLTREGDRAVLVSRFRAHFFGGDWKSKHINLVVLIPKNKRVTVEDGSGSMRISGLQNDLRISDGSGDIEIEGIVGNIDLEDGSGSIEIENVTGNVHVEDGSGDMTIRSINGNVEVSDGSGSIRLADIEKNVIIHDDGSGRVSISNVKGDVIRRDHHRDWDDD
ncbi:MAG: DUF4097 family beta strand repeat protein [Bacteroidetes bacterium]|nr:DUF4097 family beta strand repeat protein [Bacteroidota bacterium]